jgi:hypothetical protein
MAEKRIERSNNISIVSFHAVDVGFSVTAQDIVLDGCREFDALAVPQ